MNISMRLRLRRPTLCALLASSLLLPAASSHGETAPPAKPDYAASFPKKALPDGSLPPAKTNVFKLNDKGELSVKISKKDGCFFGDLDLILLEMSAGKFYELLVTLEPLDGSAIPVSSARVKSRKLGDPDLFITLKAPKVSAPTPMGLFICRDSNNQGSCKDKLVSPFRDALSRFKTMPDPAKKAEPFPDRTYFFNDVVVGPNAVEAQEPMFGPAEEERLKKITSAATVERITSLKNVLTSQPLKSNNGQLEVVLPLSDFGNCEAKVAEEQKP